MAEFKVSGRMSVESLQKQFKKEFGGTLRIYNGKRFADPKARLASIRKNDEIKSSDFKIKGNMHVGNFENKMEKEFGIKVQVANAKDTKLVPNDITLSECKNF